MKKCMVTILALGIALLSVMKVRAQDFEIQQLLLNVEKLAQLKSILEDVKKGYDIVFNGYTSIKNISEGNFSLHQLFLDGLLQVSPAVRRYYKIRKIVENSLGLIKEYKAALKFFKGSHLLSRVELNYLENVYSNLFKKSVSGLDALGTVLTPGALRMSDDERLSAIDNINDDLEDQRTFLRHFTASTKIQLLHRIKAARGIHTVRKIYGIK